MQIEYLKSEKEHLEETLQENQRQKDQYRDKNCALEAKLEETFKELQDVKREIVGINEVKADRDDRIESLCKEINELALTKTEMQLQIG